MRTAHMGWPNFTSCFTAYSSMMGVTVSGPGSLVERVQSLSDAIDRLTAVNAEKPNIDELANELGITQEEVLSVIRLTGEDTENTEVTSSEEGEVV